MMQPYQQSIQESNEDSPSSNPIQVLYHALKNVLRITTDGRVSFSKRMQYRDFHNTQDICEGLPVRLEELLCFSDYIVNGQHCALKSSTLDTILFFIFGWETEQMATKFHFLLNIFFLLHIKNSISSGKKTCPG